MHILKQVFLFFFSSSVFQEEEEKNGKNQRENENLLTSVLLEHKTIPDSFPRIHASRFAHFGKKC